MSASKRVRAAFARLFGRIDPAAGRAANARRWKALQEERDAAAAENARRTMLGRRESLSRRRRPR